MRGRTTHISAMITESTFISSMMAVSLEVYIYLLIQEVMLLLSEVMLMAICSLYM